MQYVFSASDARYYYKIDGVWVFDNPLKEKGMKALLVMAGETPARAKRIVEDDELPVVHSIDMRPPAPGEEFQEIFDSPRGKCLNTWRAPNIDPVPGAFPFIEELLSWLTGHDPAGVEWLKNWLAVKIQNPALAPGVAVVFNGQQGSGKNTLMKVIFSILGEHNCAAITQEALNTRYNANWIDKLFIFADEAMHGEGVFDLSDKVKGYITSEQNPIEGKHRNAKTQINRAAWVFASNRETPVKVEIGDRRFTTFSNYAEVSADWKARLAAQFGEDKQPNPGFMREIRAFYHYLLHRAADFCAATSPYQNDARNDLIHVNKSPLECFVEEVAAEGIDEFIDNYDVDKAMGDVTTKGRERWDFGGKGVSKLAVYQAYVQYCKARGGRAVKLNRFGLLVKRSSTPWEEARVSDGRGYQVSCYILPRRVSDDVSPGKVASSP